MVPNPFRPQLGSLHIEEHNFGVAHDASNPYAYPYFHSDGAVPLLYELVVRLLGYWEESDALIRRIQRRCIAMPSEALWRDSCGDSALHRLVSSRESNEVQARAKLQVTKAIVNACPIAVSLTNNWKETPLYQFASHCGLSNSSKLLEINMDIIRLLSKETSSSSPAHFCNYIGAFPLHVACDLPLKVADGSNISECKIVQHMAIIKHLLNCNSSVVIQKDHSGWTPLGNAVRSNRCSLQVLDLLLQNQHGFLRTKFRQRPRPTDIASMRRTVFCNLWSCYSERIDGVFLSEKISDKLQASYAASYNMTQAAQELVAEFSLLWTKTLHVLLLDGNKVVHNCISNDAPPSVIALAMCLFPHELVEQQRGQTPLVMLVGDNNKDWSNCRKLALELALGKGVAVFKRSICMVDVRGRLPFHVAIETGIEWEILQIFFDAEPRSIVARDPVSKLFPFLIAASIREPNLSTIFQLLRADPSVIAMAFNR